MTKSFSIAPVRKTLTVNAAQAHAFDVFTKGIDRWWPPEHRLAESPVKQQVIEPHVGGRWYTIHQDGSETLTGIMLAWEPPDRFVFSWNINAQWKPDTTVGSEVEVRFIAESPSVTRVELEHRKFESLGEEGGTRMRNGVDGGWPGILDLFKKEAEA
ncbi:MAG TPA: SRPBCC family protein [Rhizomicrobium sp.]|jgi:uncharacterized protein YndB with AHSA1/START domain|nr:SRPBCC family protein [Rhizomicrobium sp.]